MGDLRTQLGRRGVWGPLATLPGAELRPFVARAASLGYGSLWMGEGTSRDPFTVLAAVAESSGDMVLGTNVVNIFGRDAMASKMATMTLHELTGGRFVLGLGVSHVHLVEKLRGHRYEKPYTHMREYLAEYRRLPYRGPLLVDEAGEATEPPLMLAALRPRLLDLAATETAGTLPYLVNPDRLAWMRGVLDEAAAPDASRPLLVTAVATLVEPDREKAHAVARAWLTPYCRSVNYQASFALQGYDASDWEPPYSDRLVDDMVAWGDADAVRERLAAHDAAGADHVAIIPLTSDDSSGPISVLEALAPDS